MEFIINTNTIWDSPPRARHQLAYALAELNEKVTFISGNKFGMPSIEKKQINENLTLIVPSFPINRRFRYRIAIINEIYQLWLYRKLKKLFIRKELYVVCSDFGGYLITNFFSNVIYFASDDYINNVNVPFYIKLYTIYTQRQLIKKAQFTIATAKNLVMQFSKYNKKSFELALGAPNFSLDTPIEDILQTKHGIIKIVLLGYIDKVKTPVILLNKLLSLGNTELYLIGPIRDNILELLNYSDRIYALGIKTGKNLMETLLKMDVGIAPYFLDDPNSGRTPNKMWQYLATGLPAVISNLPNVQHWKFPKNTVYKANSDEEFVESVKLAYELNNAQLVKLRLELARNNSWIKRAEKLKEYIKDHIQL